MCHTDVAPVGADWRQSVVYSSVDFQRRFFVPDAIWNEKSAPKLGAGFWRRLSAPKSGLCHRLNFAMLLREVILPPNLISKPPREPLDSKIQFVVNFRDTLRDAQRVRKATRRSARTQKLYYDSRSKCVHFQPGQLVWLYWPKPPICQKFKKLSQLWTGPWQIDHFSSPVVTEIHSTTGKRKSQIVNFDRLLPCDQSVESSTETQDTQLSNLVSDDSPTVGEQDSQFIEDSNSFDSSVSNYSQRPIRTKRLPKSLENYIL